MDDSSSDDKMPTAYLVDLVSNRKIPISIPRCKAGRDDLNDVVITGDQSISRFHFVITKEGEQYYVQDTRSRHGTYLNGNRLSETEALKDGDVLKVGVSLFWFVIDSPNASGNVPSLKPSIAEAEAAGRRLAAQERNPATRTFDNMPAMQADSLLAARMTAKAQAIDKLGSEQKSGGLGLSKLLAQQELSEEDESEIARILNPGKDEAESVPANSGDDPDFSEFTAEKFQESARASDVKQTNAPADPPPSPEPAKPLEEEQPTHPSSTTLELFAEVIGEAATSTKEHSAAEEPQTRVEHTPPEVIKETQPSPPAQTVNPLAGSTTKSEPTQSGGNGAKDAMNMVKESTATQTGPDWLNSYLATELQSLAKDLADYNERVRQAQQKVQEIEDRIAVTKSLRHALLTTQGDELVAACIRVLTYLGWHVKPSAEDKQELQLVIDDRICIARVVWTNNTPERSHLGQLIISQTRHWCEQQAEPKGILIVSRLGKPGTNNDSNNDLAEYAGKKNVCLMTTLQLLSLYRDAVLSNVNTEGLRKEVMSSSGWLPGFNFDSSTDGGDKQDAGGNRLSSLLSA
jgi:hypothetical protein